MMIAVLVIAGAALTVPVITVFAARSESGRLNGFFTLIIPVTVVILLTAHVLDSVRVLDVALTAILVLMSLSMVFCKR